MLDFTESLNFYEYLEKQHEKHGYVQEEAYEKTTLSEKAKSEIKAINKITHVAVFAEGFCGDCVLTVPFLAKLAEENPKIKLHFFPREGFEDYLEEAVGCKKIPTVISFNSDLSIKSTYIEFPEEVRKEADDLSGDERKAFVMTVRDGKYNSLIEESLIKTLL